MTNPSANGAADIRKDLILQMYIKYQDNISKSDEIIWNVLTFYIALIAGISFFFNKESQHYTVAGLLIIIGAFLAVLLTIRQTYVIKFFVRLASNIEERYLTDSDDYGKMLPFNWKTEKKYLFEYCNILYLFYRIMAVVGLWIALILGCTNNGSVDLKYLFSVLIIILLLAILYTWRRMKNEYNSFENEFKKKTDQSLSYTLGPIDKIS